MVKLAAHQPNFCAWFPFFYKMAIVDKFLILNNVQFEKNGFQNRYKTNDKWVTKSVNNGLGLIKDKTYTSGQSLNDLNVRWIEIIKDTLEIETELVYPKWGSECEPTERLIRETKLHYCDTYVTNPEAKDKYLNEEMMRIEGIEIEYCQVPKHLQKHTFEIFEIYGIDGAIKQLPRRMSEKLNATV